jgi:hypothetical protein
VERLIDCFKLFRAIATRYDKLAEMCRVGLIVVAIPLGL